MNKLNLIIPKAEVPKWLKSILLTIQNWANNIRGITYDQLSLSNDNIPVSVINWPEHHISLILTAQDYSTVSTTEIAVGGFFNWDSGKYPTTGGSWHFEASIAVANTAATCTAELHGAVLVGSVTTASTSLVRVRSAALTMPTGAVDLHCKVKTSNASHAAIIASARLIFVPN